MNNPRDSKLLWNKYVQVTLNKAPRAVMELQMSSWQKLRMHPQNSALDEQYAGCTYYNVWICCRITRAIG